ncbi:DUF2189 domain-containing protein [Shinella zoogloeoides]|uniref:DUF2189 domain-containing protein n=1 Tax=Shinella zoogloeoides TaxID=352475 RepID=A0A6N8T6R9_SHIZO|nr:DUF2189 domain-containing protein [Shinella zoogloeoides]MXN98906.1 DUF2189 domain-containing protein [Shinella zoogloeoides]UEX83349.1 DUF2189 domain-containing protein [Shinella zoogloeoides]
MASFHVMAGPGEMLARPAIRRIGLSDIWDALARGFDDFRAKPSHYVFLSLIYPICGIVLVTWSSGANMLPLIFPLVAGFALLGPFFAIGLYEISRRRELGMDTSWRHALEVRHSPALPSILAVGAMLMVLFVAWLVFAQMLYTDLFGPEPPQSLALFLASVFSSENGLLLMLAGNAIGFCFALVVLATTVIAFPMLLDRDVGAVAAIETSLRATLMNPVPIACWGLIVAALLIVGTIPIFVGLAVIMPILGHATWHLYRKIVVDERR